MISALKELQKSFERAIKSSKSRDHVGAAGALQAAVQIDPLFAAAYNQLGAEYGWMGRFEEAKPALERAYPRTPFLWLDTEESEGEVFWLQAAE